MEAVTLLFMIVFEATSATVTTVRVRAMSFLSELYVPPSVIQLTLRRYRTTGKYRQAKMKRMVAAKVMPVARGFSQLRRL